MRRGLASLILGLSLVVASIAWSGFVLLHTVLDPGRSERLADQMLDNPVLRSVIVDAAADSLQAAVPAGVEIPRSDLEAAASAALEDPRAEALVRDGIVQIHRNALEGVEGPVTIDPAAFGAAARDALVAVRPDLAAVVPAAPSVPVTVPDAGLGFLGRARDLLEQAVTTMALAAVAGALVALVVARDRPAVLRRVALWAFAASAFWLIVAFGVPWLAERFAPASAAVFAAAIDVFLGAMVAPAVGLAVAGAVLLVASLVWGATARGARAWGRDRYDDGPHGTTAPGRSMPDPAPAASRPAPVPVTGRPVPLAGDHTTWLAPEGPGAAPGPDPWDLTRPQAAPASPWVSSEDPWSLTQPGPAPEPAPRPGRGARWVEGVGYVED